jgi:T-complex protein 1 subunit alpha
VSGCVQGTKSQAATTIVLRGANDYMLDEMDRALHDSLMVSRSITDDSIAEWLV